MQLFFRNKNEDKLIYFRNPERGLKYMERILNNDDKIRKAEEIYYRRKVGNPNIRLSKSDNEKKSYFVSKVLFEVLLIANLSIIIMAIQNKDYIFTENFLKDVENYNFNLTRTVKDFIGTQLEESTVEDTEVNNTTEEQVTEIEIQEDLVPNNEEATSSLNQMELYIEEMKNLVSIQSPILEGTITSRFGTRESSNKNVEGYHTGIDIGANSGTSIYSAIPRNSYIGVK